MTPTWSRHGAADRVAKAGGDESRDSQRKGRLRRRPLLHSSSVTVVCRATGQRLRIVNHRVCFAHVADDERSTAIGNVHLHCL